MNSYRIQFTCVEVLMCMSSIVFKTYNFVIFPYFFLLLRLRSYYFHHDLIPAARVEVGEKTCICGVQFSKILFL